MRSKLFEGHTTRVLLAKAECWALDRGKGGWTIEVQLPRGLECGASTWVKSDLGWGWEYDMCVSSFKWNVGD